jgi:hypothetical protein
MVINAPPSLETDDLDGSDDVSGDPTKDPYGRISHKRPKASCQEGKPCRETVLGLQGLSEMQDG